MTDNIPPSKCDRKDCSYPATNGTFCDVHAEEQRLVVLMEGVLLKNALTPDEFRKTLDRFGREGPYPKWWWEKIEAHDAALRAQVERVEEEAESLRGVENALFRAQGRERELRAKVEAAERLAPYTMYVHLAECRTSSLTGIGQACTCGLGEALTRVAAPTIYEDNIAGIEQASGVEQLRDQRQINAQENDE